MLYSRPGQAQHLRLLLVCSLLIWSGCSSSGIVEDKAVTSAWEEAVYKAAEAAVSVLTKQSGMEMSLREVPLDTLQVFTGRQHHIGLSLDGIQYEVVLGSEQDLSRQHHEGNAAALPSADPAQQQEGLAPQLQGQETSVASGLVRQHWQSQDQQASHQQPPTLPDVSLSGPLELRLGSPAPLSFFIPHAADTGGEDIHVLSLGPGVNVKVAGLRSIQLRRPLDLPNLPPGYLAEVYGHVKLSDPGDSFENAPGVQFLASQLKQMALNASMPLLSFDVVAASDKAGLVITSVDEVPGSPAPRLKLKKSKAGMAELTVRQGQVRVADSTESDVVQRAANLVRQYAWPLPHVDMSSLVPYEALLRSILASHPFDLMKVQRQGISLKLTKSEIRGTRLMAFEMEVRSKLPALPDNAVEQPWDQWYQTGEEEEKDKKAEDVQVMVFDVVVSVRERSESASDVAVHKPQGGSELVYVPLSVKLREVHGNTLSMSNAAMLAMLTGAGNGTKLPAPIGYEHEDLGLARQAADN